MKNRDCSLIAVFVIWILVGTACPSPAAQDGSRGTPWPIHVIDASSRGADGVRLADVNGDRLMDITTGWEEGGITRVYLHPGHEAVQRPWPAVTVGNTPSVEDAVLVDLDAEERVDVVSCCEGRTRRCATARGPSKPRMALTTRVSLARRRVLTCGSPWT